MAGPRRTLVASLAALTLLAAACGGGPTPVGGGAGRAGAAYGEAGGDAGGVTIRYLAFPATPDHLDTLDAVVAAFGEVRPDIAVEIETVPAGSYEPRLQTRLAAGEAPDAFEVDYEQFVRLASRGALADLDALSAGDPQFDAGAYHPLAYEAFSHEGVQYGLPAGYSTMLLFYNKELFDAAGLTYPTETWTWADEREAAEALSDPGSDVWGASAGVGFREFYKTAAQNGCAVLDGDEVTIARPECVEALEYMLSFVEDGLQPTGAGPTGAGPTGAGPTGAGPTGASASDLFVRGELGMITTGTWMFSAFADAPFEWDVVAEPGNSEPAHHFFARAAAVAGDSDHAEAAYRWVRFLTGSPEAARLRVGAGGELPALADASLFDPYLASEAPPGNRQAVLHALDSAVVPPVIERQAEMEDTVDRLIERAALGEMTARQALAQARREIEALRGG